MELLGLLLGIVGLLFAFERPRHWVLSFFQKPKEPLRHEFTVHTHFRTHNNGEPLGPVGTNQTENSYILTWIVWNESSAPIQLERSITMRERHNGSAELQITLPEHLDHPAILPQCKAQVLELELVPKETDNMRHWVKQCNAFGLKDVTGNIHWVPDDQFNNFAGQLAFVAKAQGLKEEVPDGIPIVIKIKKT